MRADLQCATADQPTEKEDTEVRKAARWKWLAAAAARLCCNGCRDSIGIGVRTRPPSSPSKDTIVLADFDNKTGDAVFDDTLKQGL